MAYEKKGDWDNKYRRYNAMKGNDTKFVPLLQSMTGVQRCVQDVVLKFAKKNASVRNGELLRVMPLQFEDVAICSINGRTHFWNGRYYEPMDEEDFTKFLLRFMAGCNVQAESFNSLPLISEACLNVAKSKKVRVDASKVVFKNGIYDVDNKTFVKGFDPNVVQINACDYDYELQEPMLWKSFLNQVLPDQPSQDTLQMFVGATLMPRTEAKIEEMLVLFGSGANGKSVVYETVRGVLGEGSVSSFGIDELVSDSDKKRNIADINGKRLNYCSEIRSFLGKDMYDDALKMLVSGEPIVARQMYGNNFHSRDIPLLMANTNWNMKTIPMSEALRRRIIQLNFNVAIPIASQDKALHKRLKSEYAGIFAWFVQGLDKLRGNEYKFPDEEKLPTAREEYIDRKRICGSSLWDVVLGYLTNNRYGFKMYGRRTAKFSMKLTTFKDNIEAYASLEGIGFTKDGKPTTNAIADLFKAKGGLVTKSGGSRSVTLYATPEDVKSYRDMRRKGGITVKSGDNE